jgi:hypothetical protein
MAASDFDGTEVLLVDGNNVLHRRVGTVDAAAQRALINRLRMALPPGIQVVVMFDGHADPGARSGNVEGRHAGTTSADDELLGIVSRQPELARAGTILVTDDRPLTERARQLGARTRRLDWLTEILDFGGPRRQPGAAIGAGTKPPAAPRNDDEREPWTPGRGATRKRGNPRRRPR